MLERRYVSTIVATAALVWLNVYWCREAFFLDHFGQMQSIRGFWEALARLGHFSWRPQWWPYSYNGMPFEYAYAPGVPALIAAVSRLTGWSAGHAFGVVAGFAFCFGTLALFWTAQEITQRTWWSFIAALVYCLVAPSQLLTPDAEFGLRHFGDPRRIMLNFGWDEVPHQLALAFILLSVLFLLRGFRGRTLSFWAAGFFLAVAMLVSAFGGTLAVVFLGLLWLAWDKAHRIRSGLVIAACAMAAYLAISPFFPPSLVQIIRQNANLSTEYGWTRGSGLALLAVALGTAVLLFLSRRWTWHMRFFVLLTFVCAAIPFLDRWNLHFVPQTGRYKVDLEVGFALLVTFAVARVLDRVPAIWRVALALFLLWPAVLLVKSHRVYAKAVLHQSDIHQTIEYRVASWLAVNAADERVMAPGSIGFWMNDFTSQRQFEGGSFTTMPTLTMQIATWGIENLNPYDDRREVAKLWLEAYGVDTLVVPGRASPEPWKKFAEPAQFEYLFPVLWREQDTSIYSVPRVYRSLASIVPQNRMLSGKMTTFFPLNELRQYVGAMDDPPSQVQWQWLDNNTGVARGNMPPGSSLLLHVTYNPGWKAYVNHSAVPVSADALEQLVVTPNCNGPCEVRLHYEGSIEAKVTRIASLLTMLAAAVAAFLVWRQMTAARRAVLTSPQ